MTDNEIIKALECCEVGKDKCRQCPFYCKVPACSRYLAQYALDLINRQQAEIERLWKLQKPTETSGFKIENGKVVFYTNILNGYRHEYKDLVEVVKELNLMLQSCYKCDEVVSHCKGKLKIAKSEAIKEFAKKVETELDKRVSENIRNRNPHWYIAKRIVRETAIEMTEVQK